MMYAPEQDKPASSAWCKTGPLWLRVILLAFFLLLLNSGIFIAVFWINLLCDIHTDMFGSSLFAIAMMIEMIVVTVLYVIALLASGFFHDEIPEIFLLSPIVFTMAPVAFFYDSTFIVTPLFLVQYFATRALYRFFLLKNGL